MTLEPGAAAPDFELEDSDGKLWRLSDLRGRKVILYFYPADATPGCTAQACDFRDSKRELTDAGYTVLGVSPQDADSHRSFASQYRLNFPLLIDADTEVARVYGTTADEVGDYKGIPLVIKRSTFVIDEHGKITEALYGVNARRHVGELREKLAV